MRLRSAIAGLRRHITVQMMANRHRAVEGFRERTLCAEPADGHDNHTAVYLGKVNS